MRTDCARGQRASSPGRWHRPRWRAQRGFTISELLLVVVFVVGLLLVAYTSARNIRSETATSDCQTQLRTLKLAAAQYQARTDAFPPDKRTLVVADLVAADDVELWDLSFTQGDKAPTYRAVGGTCA